MPERIRNTVRAVLADMRFKHRSHVGVYRLTRNAENYFTKVFSGSVDQAIKDGYDYNDAREALHALLKLAADASATLALTNHPFKEHITTTEVWQGLVAARWIGYKFDVTKGLRGRWCNLINPCPPEDPDCEVPFHFGAGESRSAKDRVGKSGRLKPYWPTDEVTPKVAKMWQTFSKATGAHDPSAGAAWFILSFHLSVSDALDNRGDWDADYPLIFRYLEDAGGRAQTYAHTRRDGGPTAPLLEDEIQKALRAVRDEFCQTAYPGRWCNFLDIKLTIAKKRGPRKAAKKAAKK